jgi:hypothetical protein
MAEISRELFDQQRHPRFGTSNPERMNLAFWEWMIRGPESLPPNGKRGFEKAGWSLQDGKLKSAYGPYRVRQLFNLPLVHDDGPIWTFERMGASQTELTDGRIVCVGGEHEDFYDPDFCIYNDVVVLGPADEIEIYGYPKDIFPPTDFHSAILIENHLFIVGRLGYKGERRFGITPVYRLDLSDYHIEEIATSGDMPGWIFKHNARSGFDGIIVVEGGQVIQERNGEELYRQNVEEYALDIQSGVWRQLTHRNWRQFQVRPEDRKLLVLESRPKPKDLLPASIDHKVLACDDWMGARIAVNGVPFDLKVGASKVKVLIEGELDANAAEKIIDEIRQRTEKAVGRRCRVDEL